MLLLSLPRDVLAHDVIARHLAVHDIAALARCARTARAACVDAARRTGAPPLRVALARTTYAQAATAVRRGRADPVDVVVSYARSYGVEAAGAVAVIGCRGHVMYMRIDAITDAGRASIGRVRLRPAPQHVDHLLVAAGVRLVAGTAETRRERGGEPWMGAIGSIDDECNLPIWALEETFQRAIGLGVTLTVAAYEESVTATCLVRRCPPAVSAALVRVAREAVVAVKHIYTPQSRSTLSVDIVRYDCAQFVRARRKRRHVAIAYRQFVRNAAPTRQQTLTDYAAYASVLLDAVRPRPGDHGFASSEQARARASCNVMDARS